RAAALPEVFARAWSCSAVRKGRTECVPPARRSRVSSVRPPSNGHPGPQRMGARHGVLAVRASYVFARAREKRFQLLREPRSVVLAVWIARQCFSPLDVMRDHVAR